MYAPTYTNKQTQRHTHAGAHSRIQASRCEFDVFSYVYGFRNNFYLFTHTHSHCMSHSESNVFYFIMLDCDERNSMSTHIPSLTSQGRNFLSVTHMFLSQYREQLFNKMASDIKVQTKQRCVLKFLHAGKASLIFIDIW